MMKGLLIKDLLSIKNNAKMFLLMIVFYGVLFMFMSDASYLLGVLILSFSMQVFTSFSYDEYYKWDKYALSLPVSRRDVVKSKYAVGVILIVGSAAVSYALLVATGGASGLEKGGLTAVSVASTALIYISIIIPIIYKVGVEKGRLAMVALFALSFGAITILAKSGVPLPSEKAVISWLRMLPVAAVIVFFLSYRISVGIFLKKEL